MIVVLRTLVYGSTYAILTHVGEPANWTLGMLLGGLLALTLGRRRVRQGPGWLVRLAWSPALLWGMVRQILRGSWHMLYVLIGRRPWHHVGFVEVRDVAKTTDGLTVLALIQSASPGSVAAEVDRDTRSLILNVIDAREADREAAAIRRFYDRYQKRTVP